MPPPWTSRGEWLAQASGAAHIERAIAVLEDAGLFVRNVLPTDDAVAVMLCDGSTGEAHGIAERLRIVVDDRVAGGDTRR